MTLDLSQSITGNIVAEIRTLHAEILGAVRMSITKAIRVGELLYQARHGLSHGKWLPWLEENVPFDQKTAWNYMGCFDRRKEIEAKLGMFPNLTDAYKLLTSKPNAVAKTLDLFTSIDSTEIDSSIIAGYFREATVEADSISLIFTDPTYEKEAEELFPDLADLAAEKLVAGGSILFYAGHLQLPVIFDAFKGKLRHWWTCACIHTGSMALMREYGIRAGFKPMLWFVKDRRGDVSEIVLDTTFGEESKTNHRWQQGESEAAYWIEKLCPQNGIVFDPFLGSGTTAVAAEKLKRKWLACELDEKAAALASKRIHDARI